MSHSRRKRPFTGNTLAESEKDEKRSANRRARRVSGVILRTTGDETAVPHRRAISDPWWMAKDGKQRFDPTAYPGLLRK
jgi:hypothetical protein